MTPTAHTAAISSWPLWIVSLTASAMPAVQFIAGVLAAIASGLAIILYVRQLRERK
jgi:hypothetical protein